MEFENFERELKYLIKNKNFTIKEFLDLLFQNGYKLVESFEKEKHETYYDDNNLTLLNKGDVLRGSNMITEEFKGFLYKKNMCVPDKPYVSKLEIGTKLNKNNNDINKFINDLDVGVKNKLFIKLFAKMKRKVSIVEKGSDLLYVSYDEVKYYEEDESDCIYEDMLEIEDWKKPNSKDVSDYDKHLVELNNLILSSKIPLELTKDSKYARGFLLLKHKRGKNGC